MAMTEERLTGLERARDALKRQLAEETAGLRGSGKDLRKLGDLKWQFTQL
jgi:hypothetical protein